MDAAIVIAGVTRNPWMPDQVRHDSHQQPTMATRL
jgi:hypothetical protein